MSLELCVISQIMYLEEGEIQPGDEEKVDRFEKKISEWQRDVVGKDLVKPPTYDSQNVRPKKWKTEICNAFHEIERDFGGYWCQGEECQCNRSHWVIHASATTCWECMHDPCACDGPLIWDEAENAYYRFFVSGDGMVKQIIWMTEPTSDKGRMLFKRKEKKRKDRLEKEQDLEECHEKQKQAHDQGYCCFEHAKKMKQERQIKQDEKRRKKTKVDGPDLCIHCDEEPCAFIQIESRLCENDTIYYDEGEYNKDPVAYNSTRHKRAYQYAAYILWEGINYRKPHYSCVENGVRALFPPFDGKIMGYKKE
jgi:hypothetical protein